MPYQAIQLTAIYVVLQTNHENQVANIQVAKVICINLMNTEGS